MNRVSVDPARLEVAFFVSDASWPVSADCKWLKAVCFDTDSWCLGSVDSTRVGGTVPVSAEPKGVRHRDQVPELKSTSARAVEVVISPPPPIAVRINLTEKDLAKKECGSC